MVLDHGPTVTRLFAAFNGRDLDGWMADATEDFDVESRFSSVGRTTFRGRDGVVAWWGDLAEAWDPIEAELETSRDCEHGRNRHLDDTSREGTE